LHLFEIVGEKKIIFQLTEIIIIIAQNPLLCQNIFRMIEKSWMQAKNSSKYF